MAHPRKQLSRYRRSVRERSSHPGRVQLRGRTRESVIGTRTSSITDRRTLRNRLERYAQRRTAR
ncbi:MAG: hypothetical protein ACRDKJ_04985 [Actinomycetota bacterium]